MMIITIIITIRIACICNSPNDVLSTNKQTNKRCKFKYTSHAHNNDTVYMYHVKRGRSLIR